MPLSSHHRPSRAKFLGEYASHIYTDAAGRVAFLFSCVPNIVIGALVFTPSVSASEAGYPLLNSSDPSYDEFVVGESNDSKVTADINNFVHSSIEFVA